MPKTAFQALSDDGLTLWYQEWTPEAKPLAALALVHGLGEHSGRYQHLAEALNQEGYALLTFDLRGHGRSEGQRGHTPSYDALMRDVGLLIKHARERFPEQSLFLYGHSLGGNLVLNYTLRFSAPLKGVIATSPWLKLAFEPAAVKLRMAGLMNRIWPNFSQTNELDAQALTHDEAIVHAYETDPLVHTFISARFFKSVHSAGIWALEHADRFPLPLLLMHGSADRVTSFEASQAFAARQPEQCTFKTWDGLYHELHNEPEWPDVVKSITVWLKNQF